MTRGCDKSKLMSAFEGEEKQILFCFLSFTAMQKILTAKQQTYIQAFSRNMTRKSEAKTGRKL